jgi:hypothetical protein
MKLLKHNHLCGLLLILLLAVAWQCLGEQPLDRAKLFDSTYAAKELKKGDIIPLELANLKPDNALKNLLDNKSVKKVKTAKVDWKAMDAKELEIDLCDGKTLVLGKTKYEFSQDGYGLWYGTSWQRGDKTVYATGMITIAADGKVMVGSFQVDANMYRLAPLDEEGNYYALIENDPQQGATNY